MTDTQAMSLRLATRGSALALVQTGLVRDALAAIDVPTELVIVETAGDRRASDTPWGEGAFVAAIEQALLDGRADIAVHSAKDVPLDGDTRLTIAAYLMREDPRDALVVRGDVPGDGPLTLPPGAIVGTDSPRRGAFLHAIRADLDVRAIHGNVDTRLRRLDTGEADALILAVAGLDRLGRADRITSTLEPSDIPPAPGQGAIAVQVRAQDDRARVAVGRLDHPPTRRAVEAERAFLDACGGGCRAAVGALATEADGSLRLLGGLADGRGRAVTGHGDASEPALLAARLADQLASEDAPAIAVTRPIDQATPLVRELAMQGIRAARIPTIAIERCDPSELTAALDALPDGAWVVVTSANGARAIRHIRRGLHWATLGSSTAAVLARAGVIDPWLPSRADGATLARELPVAWGTPCLLIRGDLADPSLPQHLEARGARVREVTAYRTIEGPDASRDRFTDAWSQGVQGFTFASGSAIRGLMAIAGDTARDVTHLPALCIGPTTARAARDAGFGTVLVATAPTDAALAELAATSLAVPA